MTQSILVLTLFTYVEALFGPNQIYTGSDNTVPSPGRHGITSELVLLIEGELSPHIRWRILEFTQGTFTGIPDSNLRSLTTGFVAICETVAQRSRPGR